MAANANNDGKYRIREDAATLKDDVAEANIVIIGANITESRTSKLMDAVLTNAISKVDALHLADKKFILVGVSDSDSKAANEGFCKLGERLEDTGVEIMRYLYFVDSTGMSPAMNDADAKSEADSIGNSLRNNPWTPKKS